MSNGKTGLIDLDKYTKDSYGNCLNYIREELEPHKVRFHVPGGVHYEAFDPTGSQLYPWSLLELIDCVYADVNFAEINHILQENFEFYATVLMRVEHDFHDISSPKFPLQVLFELAFIGNTSYRTTRTLSHPDREKPYATCSVQSVVVNKESRKPIKLSEWWRNKYGPHCEKGIPLKMETLTRPFPANITSFPLTVYNSHCDMYKHTHYSNYILFCYNAYVDGVNRQKYSHVTQNSLNKGIKTLQISYKQESVLGDNLVVDSWEDKDIKHCLNFEIKKDNIICCQATISFYN